MILFLWKIKLYHVSFLPIQFDGTQTSNQGMRNISPFLIDRVYRQYEEVDIYLQKVFY